MKPVPLTRESQFQAALQRAKTGAREFSMNLFAGPETMNAWMAQGRLELLEASTAALFLLRDRDFRRLFHVAPNRASLADALAILAGLLGSRIVTDLVGRQGGVEPLIELHAARGFRPHSRLFRMAALGMHPLSCEAGPKPGIDYPGPATAPEVLAFLEARLDPLAERIPELDDLRMACAHNEVLCCREEGVLAGVLVMGTSGCTTMLRYWFVDKRHQGLGLGGRLIRGLFRACPVGSRVVLWVLADNQDAIAKYEHYGFRLDGLMDQVMVLDPGEG